MSSEVSILDKSIAYAQQFLLDELPPEYVFHNFEHTEAVIDQAKALAKAAKLETEATEVLLLAACFHDLGFAKSGKENHEEKSAAIAAQFLKHHTYPSEKIQQVQELIRSTHEEVLPQSELEKILHDADWSFLGRKRFFRRVSLLRLEREQESGMPFTQSDWEQEVLELQLSTKFQTSYAHDLYTKRKNKNISEQRELLFNARKKTTRIKTGKDFGRGIDTIYRITLRNHINLSNIADGKANMIISINTLVLSILITAASASFGSNAFSLASRPGLYVPLVILMLTALAAIIFAVFSAIPKTSGTSFTKEELRDHKVSMLFFGNFLRLEKEEFVDYLSALKEDQEVLYNNLSRDLYNLGKVLRKKYRLLTIAYRIFVGGLVLSVLSFLVFYFLV